MACFEKGTEYIYGNKRKEKILVNWVEANTKWYNDLTTF